MRRRVTAAFHARASSALSPSDAEGVVALVRARRYEDAIERLAELSASHPGDGTVRASIRILEDHLVREYARALGGLDRIPLAAELVVAPGDANARQVHALLDGSATLGDILRQTPLTRLETLRVLRGLVPSAPVSRRRKTLEFYGQPAAAEPAPAPPRRGGEELQKILESLHAAAPQVEACALISNVGEVLASALPHHIDGERVASISVVMSTLGARAASALDRGELDEILVRSTSGYVVLAPVAKGAFIVCHTADGANLGLVLLDVRRAIDRARTTLGPALAAAV